jgi:hypothetical protein
MRGHFRLVTLVLLCAVYGSGCGASMYDSPKPSTPGAEPFVAKGKLKAEMQAKAAGKKVPGRSATGP